MTSPTSAIVALLDALLEDLRTAGVPVPRAEVRRELLAKAIEEDREYWRKEAETLRAESAESKRRLTNILRRGPS